MMEREKEERKANSQPLPQTTHRGESTVTLLPCLEEAIAAVRVPVQLVRHVAQAVVKPLVEGVSKLLRGT